MTNFLKNKWAVAIIILVVINLATVIFFWFTRLRDSNAPPPPPQAIGRGTPPPFLMHELNFTQQQQKQYEALFHEHRQQVRSLKDSIRKAKEDFFSLLSTANASTEELQRRAAVSAQLDERLDMLTFDHFRKVKAICTPQQQQKFDKVIHTVIERMAPPPPPPPPPGEEGRNGDRPPPHGGLEGEDAGRPPPPKR